MTCSVKGCKDEVFLVPYGYCKKHAKIFLESLTNYAKEIDELTYRKAEENFYLTDNQTLDEIEKAGIILEFYLLLANDSTKKKLKEFSIDLQKKFKLGDDIAVSKIS